MTLPNIVFILSDDQGYWALGSSGNREIITPNLDRLALSGMRFENMFCVSPVCSPARASLLTGRIPSQHGILDWLRAGNVDRAASARLGYEWGDPAEHAVQYLKHHPGYTQVLADHGYTCGLSGKWHLGDSLAPQQGFSFWRVIPGGGSNYMDALIYSGEAIRPAPGYLTDVICDNAIAFLDQQAGKPNPFYLALNTNAPHSPWIAKEHPDDLRALYDGCPFESVPDLPEAHPWQINSAPRGRGERRRELLTGYYAAISGVDRLVGRITTWLEEHGLLEDTLIIFTSDNGMNMGHHGLWGKGNATYPANMYEESVRVPFIISQPGRILPGGQSDAIISHLDVYPTLLDWLGLPLPSGEDSLPGRSFAPNLRGGPVADRPVFIYDEYGPTRMVRTRDWKYIHRYQGQPCELYHLDSDPGETHNLIADPSSLPMLAALRSELLGWFDRWASPEIDGSREPVTGKGQLGPHQFASDWYTIDADGHARNPDKAPRGPDRSF